MVASKIRQLGKDTVLYGLGTSLQGMIGFLLFPIYTRTLTQVDFGKLDLVLTSITIISLFLFLGLDSGAARHYYDGNTPEYKSKVLSTWLWFELTLSIPVSILLIVFAEPLCKIIFNVDGLESYFRVGVITLIFTVLSRIFYLTLRLNFQPKKFVLLTTVDGLIQALAIIFFVVYARMGVTGVFLGILLARIIACSMGFIMTRENFRPQVSNYLIKSMLRFGVPLLPGMLALWMLNSSNRYFLTRFTSLSDVALYAAGARVVSVITLLTTAFQNAWPPFAYSLLTDTELAKKTYAKALYYYLVVAMLAGTALCVFGREVIIFLATPAYESSSSVLPWLIYSSIAWGTVMIVGIGYEIAKKTFHTSVSTMLGALVTVILNILLIPKLWIVGASVATLIGSLVSLVYSFFAGQFYFSVAYDIKKIVVLVILSSAVVAIAQRIDIFHEGFQLDIFLQKGVLILLLIALLFALRIITVDMVQQVKEMVLIRIKP